MGNTTVATADYGTVLTAIGTAKIAACILNGTKLNITHAAVGDGNGAYYKPTAEQECLLNECWRGEIASYKINESNANMLDVKFIVPAEVGGFTIREAALFDADGDMVAICNTPDAQKVVITDGVSFPVTMLMHIIVTDVSAVEVIVNSSLNTVSSEEMHEAIDSAMATFANGVGSALIRPITIPAADWVEVQDGAWDEVEEETEGRDKYKYMVDLAVDGALAEHYPDLTYGIHSREVAGEAGVCPNVYTLDGIVRFFTETIPPEDLNGTIMLRSENLVDLDLATDEEIDDTVDGVYGDGSSSGLPDGYTVATKEDVQTEVVEGVFGQ